MMTKKPNWQKRTWWEELLGVYRDERVDAINRVAIRRAYWSTAVFISLLGIYMIGQRDWLGWVVLGIVASTFGYVYWRFRTLGGPNFDEWSRYQYERPFLFLSIIVMLVPVFFFLAPVETAVGKAVWSLVLLVSFVLASGTQFSAKAYPRRTWILTLIAGIGGVIFGGMMGSGAFSSGTLWIVGISYVAVLVVLYIYWYRRRRW